MYLLLNKIINMKNTKTKVVKAKKVTGSAKKMPKMTMEAYYSSLKSASNAMVEEAYNNAESPAPKKKAAERALVERGLL